MHWRLEMASTAPPFACAERAKPVHFCRAIQQTEATLAAEGLRGLRELANISLRILRASLALTALPGCQAGIRPSHSPLFRRLFRQVRKQFQLPTAEPKRPSCSAKTRASFSRTDVIGSAFSFSTSC